MRLLISKEKINARLDEMAKEIEKSFEDITEPIIFVSILKGSAIFFADLVRRIKKDIEFDFLQISSYEGNQTTADIRLVKDLQYNIKDRHVMIVEDIVDSGLSLEYLLDLFAKKQPKTLKTCTLLDKPSRRRTNVKADFTGFEIEDLFVIGYGLDYNQHYRNLDGVYVLE